MHQIDPPPSIVDLVKKDPRANSTWINWLNNLYLYVKEVAEMAVNNALKSAFNEQLSADITPVVNINFDYIIHPDLVTTFNNNGVVSAANEMAVLSTGAFANRSAEIQSTDFVDSHAGIGTMVRMSTIFGTPNAGSTQYCGLIDLGDGHAFGYLGEDFGIITRANGLPEIRVLTLTAASTTNENITITLDGDADVLVAVTNTGNLTNTANEIAAHDYSHLGRGWSATAIGNQVEFKSYNAGAKSGGYAVSGTTVNGGFGLSIAGASPTENFIKQTSWDLPNQNGFNPQKGNIYQIK